MLLFTYHCLGSSSGLFYTTYYLITKAKVLLEGMSVMQLGNKFTAFQGTQNFPMPFTRAHK